MTQKKKSDARRITTKFPSVCKSCGKELPVGSKVTWYPGGTVYGTTCHKSPFENSKPKTEKKSTPAPSKGAVDINSLVELLKAQHPSVQKAFLQTLLKK